MRKKVVRAASGFNANRRTVRGNAATRAKKTAVTSRVRSMKAWEYEYQSPRAQMKAFKETGSIRMPSGKAKRMVAHSANLEHGLKTFVKRGTKKTFTGKKIRWW